MTEYIIMEFTEKLSSLEENIAQMSEEKEKQTEILKDIREYLSRWSLKEGYMDESL